MYWFNGLALTVAPIAWVKLVLCLRVSYSLERVRVNQTTTPNNASDKRLVTIEFNIYSCN